MGQLYYCQKQERREWLTESTTINGIDYLEVVDIGAPTEDLRQRILKLTFFNNIAVDKLKISNIQIDGGVRIRDIEVIGVGIEPPDADNILTVRVDVAGDFSPYYLRLINLDEDSELDGKFDVQFREVMFSFKVMCPSDFDCHAPEIEMVRPVPGPPLNYLAKDYAGFRQSMLDRLSTVLPEWKERHEADLGIAIVEVLAYAADYLSYNQDAVANEAYLGIARQRTSVRRHARLLDYRMHDGWNARVWVQIEPEPTVNDIVIPEHTTLLTQIPNREKGLYKINAGEDWFDEVRQYQPTVFETMHPITLYSAHHEMEFYTWLDEDCCLLPGATKATLKDNLGNRLRLRAGDILIIEEKLDPESESKSGRNPAHRQAVRLTSVVPEANEGADGLRTPGDIHKDDLTNEPIVEIEWHEEDALSFPCCICKDDKVISIVRGNIVLADHGRSVQEEINTKPELPRYRSRLQEPNITCRVPYRAFDDDSGQWRPASEALTQNSQEVLPDMTLVDNGDVWIPRWDLLDSGEFDRHFVVETDNNHISYLRFNKDGIYGRKPPDALEVRYRTGNGLAGNVGFEAIAHLVSSTDLAVASVSNPLPSRGGTDPETMEHVRLNAPYAFRTQERAVTEEDYREVTQRHHEVQRAEASRRWTGSWYTMFITVDRKGGREIDAAFEKEIRRHLDIYRLAGQDVEIDGPRFVPLDLACTVCVKENFYRTEVQKNLLDVFSNRELSDGTLGFFHPDNLTFGQFVYLSRIIAAAMKVPGVKWVDFSPGGEKDHRFRRWGYSPDDEFDLGYIKIGRLEIARLDNDPNAPENGKIEFYMKGGL